MLELARDLLARAEQDAQQQMPVIFPLSSWAAKQQPLAEWMREELINKYQVPRQLAHVWVETDQILPLLDGLDEVETLNRTKCIEAINTYHQEHALLPLVVSSRSADYLQQMGRVRLTSAVTIQSLTQQQVDNYLARGGESLWALRVALHRDAALRELAETPLMLSILTLTYHDMPVEDLLRGGIAPTRQQVFERYVERMLTRRGETAQYQAEQVRDWLTWLAKQLVQHRQTVLYIERMQQNWLPNKRIQKVYRRVVLRLQFGLIFGLIGTAAGWLGDGLTGGLIGGIIFGLFCGIVGGRISKMRVEIQPTDIVVWSWRRMWRNILTFFSIGLVVGLVIGWWAEPVRSLSYTCSNTNIGNFICTDISAPLVEFFFISAIKSGFIIALGIAMIAGLIGGWSREVLPEHIRITPNQGVRRSAQNSLRVALISGLGSGVVIVGGLWLIVLLSGNFFINIIWILPYGGSIGLVGGLIGGYFNGGRVCLQHYVLRFFLWRAGAIPWNFPRFLDYAAERILLRKVGGGYIFVHRLLLEYFASLDTTSIIHDLHRELSH